MERSPVVDGWATSTHYLPCRVAVAFPVEFLQIAGRDGDQIAAVAGRLYLDRRRGRMFRVTAEFVWYGGTRAARRPACDALAPLWADFCAKARSFPWRIVGDRTTAASRMSDGRGYGLGVRRASVSRGLIDPDDRKGQKHSDK